MHLLNVLFLESAVIRDYALNQDKFQGKSYIPHIPTCQILWRSLRTKVTDPPREIERALPTYTILTLLNIRSGLIQLGEGPKVGRGPQRTVRSKARSGDGM